jgi:putative mRNA 3-end processing factor
VEKTVYTLNHGKKISVSLGEALTVRTPSFTIALDPARAVRCDYSFVSHAHIDHVHSPKRGAKIVASKETASLAKARGYNLGETIEEAPRIDLLDAGHIYGSRGILIEDSVFYTGDVSTRKRGFLRGFGGVKCDVLIIETTYGRSRYVFPETEELAKQVNRFIASCFDNGKPVILTGYPLGKAQILSDLFDCWDPMFVHEYVHRMNAEHRALGLELKDCERFTKSSEFEGKLRKGPWVMLAPSSSHSSFTESLSNRYHAAVATFTGWALDSWKRQKSDYYRAFPLSDHCDFRELVDLVKRCDPTKIFTLHGFAEEFASHLRTLGFDAEALSSATGQMPISAF